MEHVRYLFHYYQKAYNNREEQRQVIRDNPVVANLVVFRHMVSMTRIFQKLVEEDDAITPEIIAHFSPYRTEHLNRFGSYDVRFDHKPPHYRTTPALTRSRCEGA